MAPDTHAGDRPTRTLSLDSGLYPGIGTSRAFRNLWFEWEGFGGSIFDRVSEGTFMGKSLPLRVLWAGLWGIGWYWADYTWFVSNHEYGHGTRNTALGFGSVYSWNGSGQHSQIFSFLAEGFLRYGSGAMTQGTTGFGRANPSQWGLVTTANGMNASQMMASDLEDQLALDGGHALQSGAYYYAKTDTLYYALATLRGTAGDVSNLLSSWAARGIRSSAPEIAIGGAVSLLGSASTYSYLWSLLRYMGTGDARTYAPMVGALRLPDVAFFLNPDGPSYRLKTEFRTGSSSGIPISLEAIYGNGFTVEGSLGYRSASRFLAKAYLNTRLGLGVELAKTFALSSHFWASLGTGAFTTASLHGQREVDYLLADAFGVNAWGRLSYVF